MAYRISKGLAYIINLYTITSLVDFYRESLVSRPSWVYKLQTKNRFFTFPNYLKLSSLYKYWATTPEPDVISYEFC